MSRILVATHSTLAEGFADAVRFFMPDASNVSFVNGYVESPELERELRESLEGLTGDGPTVVCTDIPGGSVNQVAMRLAGEYRFFLVSGINLPILLELVLATDLDDETLSRIVGEARVQLMLPLVGLDADRGASSPDDADEDDEEL